MLSLKQILQATPEAIRKRARVQCYGQSFALPRNAEARRKATKAGGYLVKDDTGEYREFKYRVKCTDGWRKVALRFYGPMNVNTPIWCWCSCPYFKYHCEVALATKGSSSVVQSNGQRPRFTNPKMEPRVCKHCYLAFALAMRRRPPTQDKVMGALNKGASVRRQMNTKSDWAGDLVPKKGNAAEGG